VQVSQASRLRNVTYDIRGPVLRRARQLEAEGHPIIKLNLGNPAPFGLFAPDDVIRDVLQATGYRTLEASRAEDGVELAAAHLPALVLMDVQLPGISGVEGLALSDTVFTSWVPGLLRAIRACHADGVPTERRAKVFRGADRPPLELVIWLTPLPVPGYEVHVIVRASEG